MAYQDFVIYLIKTKNFVINSWNYMYVMQWDLLVEIS